MKILMLGWEFPPYLTGGLGTACYGLTRAMAQAGAKVIFVMPRPITPQPGDHVRVVAPSHEAYRQVVGEARPAPVIAHANAPTPVIGPRPTANAAPQSPHATIHATIHTAATAPGAPSAAASSDASSESPADPLAGLPVDDPDFSNVDFRVIDLPGLVSPYQSERPPEPAAATLDAEPFSSLCRAGFGRADVASDPSLSGPEGAPAPALTATPSAAAPMPPTVARPPVPAAVPPTLAARPGPGVPPPPPQPDYPGDLVVRCQMYARLAVDLARKLKFDVIHAHDWMAFPAGLAVSAATGKPLIVHVHSTEYDRATLRVNPHIVDIERRGMMGAMRVIAVSLMTKSLLQRRYGVPGEKITVVHNGFDAAPAPAAPTGARPVAIGKDERVVLFLGRLTSQKGPEHFLAAAKKVLEKMRGVKFVIAGTGDMTPQMVEAVASSGLGGKVLFTGFLRLPDVERIFALADVYVMPSVSEPFGITALEAIRHDVPVILSKNAGVSEVIRHALKADFWDATDMADKIIAVLRHPPLASTLRRHADVELRELTWAKSARRCLRVCREVRSAARVAR